MGVCLLVTAASVALRWWLDPWFDEHLAFATLFPAVAAMAVWAGWQTAAASALLGWVALSTLIVEPRSQVWSSDAAQVTGTAAFVLSSLVVITCGELFRSAHRRARAERELPVLTLRSIGDGVLVTDADGRVRDVGPQRAAERALLNRERDLSDFFDNADVGPDGTILRANRAELEMLGYREDEYVGHGIHEFHADDDVIAEILEVLSSGRQLSRKPARLRHKNGSIRDVLISSSVLFEGGEFVHTRCFTLDITDLKRTQDMLARSEARFRELANSIDQMVWTCDELGEATWYNDRWFEFTGMDRDSSQGRSWESFQHPDHAERVKVGLECCAEAGLAWEDTFPLRGRDGGYRWFLSRATPIYDDQGRVVRWFGTNTDVTEMREMQQALRDADRRKDDLLAMLAHELRCPLAPIRNAVDVLQAHPEALTDEETTWAHGVIDRQARQMARLLDDLLDVSRFTHGKIELRRRRVSIDSVLDNAVEASRPAIEGAELEFESRVLSEPLFVEGDPARLAQVFSNLLGNAAKYTDPGGRVTLSVERDGGSVVVSVRDDGIGFDPRNIHRLFDLFVQDERGRRRSQGGLGIGLTLAQRIVELHGGRIRGVSEGPDKGSEFIVTLPLSRDEVPSAAAPAPRPNGQTARNGALRMLIADDHRLIADSLSLLLQRLGHQTSVAYDGPSTLEAAREFRPHVALLDIGMPGFDGHEACRRLRDLEGGDDMLIIALTGWGQDEDMRRTQQSGFDHHMVKPIDRHQLMEWVEAYLSVNDRD